MTQIPHDMPRDVEGEEYPVTVDPLLLASDFARIEELLPRIKDRGSLMRQRDHLARRYIMRENVVAEVRAFIADLERLAK